MATEIDLFFSYGDDNPRPSTDVPAEIDQPVLNRLDRQRYEYRGQMIEKVKGGFQVQGDDAKNRTIFHATTRVDELHKAAFDPHNTKIAAGLYEVAGERIQKMGSKWQVASTGQTFRTLTQATQNVSENLQRRFTDPQYQESVGYIPASSLNAETVSTPPTEPTLQKIKAGSYSYMGTDISKVKSKWMVGEEAHPTLSAAVESIKYAFDTRQPQHFVLDTQTGAEQSYDFQAHNVGPGGQRPFAVDSFTRVSGDASTPHTRRHWFDIRDYEQPRSIDIFGSLNPQPIRPPSSMNQAGSSNPVRTTLDPPEPVNAVVTTLSPLEEFRERKYGLLKELSDRGREGTKAFADQQSLIASNFKQHRSDIRNQMREIQSNAAGRRQGLYGIFHSLGLPGYVSSSITDRTIFTTQEQQRLDYHRETLRDLEAQYVAKRQDLRDKRHDFRQAIADARYAYRGASMNDPSALNTPIPNVPNFNPLFAPPTTNAQAAAAAAGGGGGVVPPSVNNPGAGAGGNGGGGLAGALQSLAGGGGPAFLQNLAVIGAIIGIASAASEKFKRIGSAATGLMGHSVEGLTQEDPVGYYIEGARRRNKLINELDMTGTMQIATSVDEGRNTILATIEQHTRYITQKMGAFAPQTMYQSIEDRLRLFENDIENASRIDPTVASINASKTDVVIAMRDLKTSLVEAFGPQLAGLLDGVASMLRLITMIVDLIKTIVDFLLGWAPWLARWLDATRAAREAKRNQAAGEIQNQLRDFFGTK